MALRMVYLVSGSILIAGSASALTPSGQVGCQERADKIARAVGVPTSPVSEGAFFVTKDKVAVVYGECKGSLSVRPDPEPFMNRLSPDYPSLAVRAAAASFDLGPADAKHAIAACLKAAVADPPQHSSKAGFARQRWQNSQMTGTIQMRGLKWDCTYHNSATSAASLEITKPDEPR